MKKRIWWLIAVSMLLMGVGMVGSQAVLKAASVQQKGAKNDLIAVTAGASGSQALSLDDIAAIQSAVDGSRLSWWAAGRGSIGTDERNTQADVYAVSGEFQDFHPVQMLYGSFIPRTSAGSMACVLESDLAYRLFGTNNAVGLEVQFMGKTFQVCGVCKTDSSLLGLMSGNGGFRAYVSGDDLVNTGKMTIGGFEALVPAGAPGESLQSITSAMQSQSISTGGFLIEDKTDQMRLDGEVALIPLVLFSISAFFVLLAFFIRVCRGVFRESLALLHDAYFGDALGALAWKLAKVVLLFAASVGLCWAALAATGLNFYLPAKYIPSSWIDPSFYSGLVKSESQAAIAAQAYPRQWWDIAYAGAVRLSGILNSVAILGIAVSALSLRALRSDRRLAAAFDPESRARGVWDAPVFWILAFLSFCGAVLIDMWMGLPLQSGLGALLAIAIVLGIWAVNMHREELERLFFREEFSSSHKKEESAADV